MRAGGSRWRTLLGLARAGLAVAALGMAAACSTSAVQKIGPARIPPDEPWRSARPQAGPVPEFKLPAIQQAELKNGLRVLVVEEHSLPAVHVGVVSRAGSAHEPVKEAGIARLAWGTVDEGAGGMTDLALANAFANIGATIEVQADTEFGALRALLLKEHLDTGVELLATVMRKPTFGALDVERVRNQLIGALRERDGDPALVADFLVDALIYGADHAYGHDGMGATATLDKLTAARVKKFWADSVGPRNSVLIMVGDVTLDEARGLAEKHFGKWSGGPKSVKVPPDPRPLGGFKIAFVDVPGAQQTAIRLGRPVVGSGDPDTAALLVLDAVMGGQFSSRLNLKLREEKQWTYGCTTAPDLKLGKGTWGIGSCEVQTAATADALVEILAILDPSAVATVSDDEITRAKGGWMRSLPGLLGLPSVQMRTVGDLFVRERPQDEFSVLAEAVGAVDGETVRNVMSRVLVKEDMVVVLVGDRATAQPLLEQKGFTGITYYSPRGVELKGDAS